MRNRLCARLPIEPAATVLPALLFGLRLWASVCLALYVAFWLELDNAYWAGTTAALACQPHLGASLRKGWFRMLGTFAGCIAVVVLTACFPQDRVGFLLGLALCGGGCALAATLLRNIAAYVPVFAGITLVIIASAELGATGGLDKEVLLLAVDRAAGICIGILSAGIVLAMTDFGQARRRLAGLIGGLAAEIAGRFAATLAHAGGPIDTPARHELIRRVIALDTVIDEAYGESSELRYHSPILQNAVDGLFTALAGWRTVATHLDALPDANARRAAGAVLPLLPSRQRAPPAAGDAARWIADPVGLRHRFAAAMRRLAAMATDAPSLRLLADQAARAVAGIAQALNGVALLVADPARPAARTGWVQLRVPDWWPAFVNGGRAVIAILAAEIFWIVTAWPNGAMAVTFTAIVVMLFAPRADQAYESAIGFLLGAAGMVPIAAALKFAVLPNLEAFGEFALVIGCVLVPLGALVVWQWQPAVCAGMVTVVVPLLAPANPMSYDQQQFYNSALAIIAGVGAGAFAYRLLPPPPPELRAQRLLALSLRDLHGLATGAIPGTPREWQSRIFGRLVVLPDVAQPVYRARLAAMLTMGTQMIALRRAARRFGLETTLDAALQPLVDGNSALAAERLARLDAALADLPGTAALRQRGRILAMSETLAQHAAFFDAGAPR